VLPGGFLTSPEAQLTSPGRCNSWTFRILRQEAPEQARERHPQRKHGDEEEFAVQ